jgi:hypothetical protein
VTGALSTTLAPRPNSGERNNRPSGGERNNREAVVMAKDLPNRPKRDPNAPVTKISDTDRVKAKTDKLDPRFEAARLKILREEERRAKAEAAREAKRQGKEPAAGPGPDKGDGSDDDTPPTPPKQGFSFNNQTAPRPSGGERTEKDAS